MVGSNPATVVTDSVDKDFQQLLLADSVLSGKSTAQGGGHASILSELNLMRLAGSAYGLRKVSCVEYVLYKILYIYTYGLRKVSCD